MKRNAALQVVNGILAVLVTSQAVTGFARHRLSHETFELLHERGAYLLVAFVLAHVVLNWGWIRANYLSRK